MYVLVEDENFAYVNNNRPQEMANDKLLDITAFKVVSVYTAGKSLQSDWLAEDLD